VATAIAALTPNAARIETTDTNRQRTTATADAGFARALDAASGPQIVAPVRTKLDSGQASAALREALRNVTGREPSEGSVRILTAQWAHETGHGASMYNYNFGGIKGTGPSGLSVAQRTREGYGETERTITDRFRAYRTAEEGATDYVKLLAKRFPEALEAANQTDPVGFVQGLKSRGYFTGDPAAYTRSVVSLSGMQITENATRAPELNAAPVQSARVYNQYEPAYDVASFTQPPLLDGLRIAAEATPTGEDRQ